MTDLIYSTANLDIACNVETAEANSWLLKRNDTNTSLTFVKTTAEFGNTNTEIAIKNQAIYSLTQEELLYDNARSGRTSTVNAFLELKHTLSVFGNVISEGGITGGGGQVAYDGGRPNTDFSVGLNINCGGVT